MNAFDSEVRERKRLVSSARHKKNGSKSKRCSLPSDHLTERQWKARCGEIMEYKLSSPVPWAEFKRYHSVGFGKAFWMPLCNDIQVLPEARAACPLCSGPSYVCRGKSSLRETFRPGRICPRSSSPCARNCSVRGLRRREIGRGTSNVYAVLFPPLRWTVQSNDGAQFPLLYPPRWGEGLYLYHL